MRSTMRQTIIEKVAEMAMRPDTRPSMFKAERIPNMATALLDLRSAAYPEYNKAATLFYSNTNGYYYITREARRICERDYGAVFPEFMKGRKYVSPPRK